MKSRGRILAALVTVAVVAGLLYRIPIRPMVIALQGADYPMFLALMIPNTIFYFCWDTLVLDAVIGWFHGEVPYRDLLPIRAVSYVVGFFNTNGGRGALAAYLWRKLDAPFLLRRCRSQWVIWGPPRPHGSSSSAAMQRRHICSRSASSLTWCSRRRARCWESCGCRSRTRRSPKRSLAARRWRLVRGQRWPSRRVNYDLLRALSISACLASACTGLSKYSTSVLAGCSTVSR